MRKFGNRMYSFYALCDSKKLAQGVAQRLRGEGKLARVIKGSCFAFTGDYYVYEAISTHKEVRDEKRD